MYLFSFWLKRLTSRKTLMEEQTPTFILELNRSSRRNSLKSRKEEEATIQSRGLFATAVSYNKLEGRKCAK